MTRRRQPTILSLSLGFVFASAAVASADVVHLRDGRTLAGQVTRLPDGRLRVKQRFGEVTVEQREVSKVVRGEPSQSAKPAKRADKEASRRDEVSPRAAADAALAALHTAWKEQRQRAPLAGAIYRDFVTLGMVVIEGAVRIEGKQVGGKGSARKKPKQPAPKINRRACKDLRALEKLLEASAPKLLDTARELRKLAREEGALRELEQATRDLELERCPLGQRMELIHTAARLAELQRQALEWVQPKLSRVEVVGQLRALRKDAGELKGSRSQLKRVRSLFGTWETATKLLYKIADDLEDQTEQCEALAKRLGEDELGELLERSARLVDALAGRRFGARDELGLVDWERCYERAKEREAALAKWDAATFRKAVESCWISGRWSSLTEAEAEQLTALRKLQAALPSLEQEERPALAFADGAALVFCGDEAALRLVKSEAGWRAVELAPAASRGARTLGLLPKLVMKSGELEWK